MSFPEPAQAPAPQPTETSILLHPRPSSSRPRITKLVPPRPFPTVAPSAPATGPRSSHREGKNCICITRKTALGAYMRRCKDVILKDGYKTLHLSAMGAAIPLLLQLTFALPPILPFAADEVRVETTTGTLEVTDEIIPEDEDEDITYRTRGKSTLRVVIKIGDGEKEDDVRRGTGRKGAGGRSSGGSGGSGRGNKRGAGDGNGDGKRGSRQIVLQEPEQEIDLDMI